VGDNGLQGRLGAGGRVRGAAWLGSAVLGASNGEAGTGLQENKASQRNEVVQSDALLGQGMMHQKQAVLLRHYVNRHKRQEPCEAMLAAPPRAVAAPKQAARCRARAACGSLCRAAEEAGQRCPRTNCHRTHASDRRPPSMPHACSGS
jgi:hypothetical protein